MLLTYCLYAKSVHLIYSTTITKYDNYASCYDLDEGSDWVGGVIIG